MPEGLHKTEGAGHLGYQVNSLLFHVMSADTGYLRIRPLFLQFPAEQGSIQLS